MVVAAMSKMGHSATSSNCSGVGRGHNQRICRVCNWFPVISYPGPPRAEKYGGAGADDGVSGWSSVLAMRSSLSRTLNRSTAGGGPSPDVTIPDRRTSCGATFPVVALASISIAIPSEYLRSSNTLIVACVDWATISRIGRTDKAVSPARGPVHCPWSCPSVDSFTSQNVAQSVYKHGELPVGGHPFKRPGRRSRVGWRRRSGCRWGRCG